jgi:tripartite-type tricarboxylate transporter receptor subunit TctC
MHRKLALMRFLRAVAQRGAPFVLAAAAAASAPALAAENPAFYAGKTMRVLVGFGPGGGYDIYARELGRFLGRHIPGNTSASRH